MLLINLGPAHRATIPSRRIEAIVPKLIVSDPDHPVVVAPLRSGAYLSIDDAADARTLASLFNAIAMLIDGYQRIARRPPA